jgi:hypothetical protein
VVGTTFIEVIEYLLERCTTKELAMHAKIARRIWLRRNTMVHRGGFIHPNDVIRLASKFIDDYREVMQKEKATVEPAANPGSSIADRWRPPPPRTLKTNWDAALDLQSRTTGLGFIVRYSNGMVYTASSFSVKTCTEPVAVESFATLRAVEFCRSRGLTNIILEGDSLQVVNSIKKKNLDLIGPGPGNLW